MFYFSEDHKTNSIVIEKYDGTVETFKTNDTEVNKRFSNELKSELERRAKMHKRNLQR